MKGTTSACAENTISAPVAIIVLWNYLRVRGEYSISDAELLERLELPPRARRILRYHPRGTITGGTTSACAENTHPGTARPATYRNYLRVRGEYLFRASMLVLPRELPPRARRIHEARANPSPSVGTTSACAENTLNELGLL